MSCKKANGKIAIKLSGIKKQYQIGAIGGKTLKNEMQSWWAKIHGREDPNIKIGMDQRLIGKKFMALNGIDLVIHKGERIGIIGANGAGKSTMLKLLSRVTAPTEGYIEIYGRISSMLEVGTGFHGEMTGRENIYMNGAILGMTKDEIDSKIEKIIDFSEIREYIDTPVKRYSSGMFVKLAFSVAAHLNSEILIMDEVLAVGDMSFQKKCLEKMRKTSDEEGRTILYVSHNMDTIRNLCERCVVLDQGKVIFDGDVEKAISIYMNRSINEEEVDMDLTKKFHSSNIGKRGFVKSGFCMEHLTLKDKVLPIYEEGEDLHLLIRVHLEKPLADMRIRLTFRDDRDIGVGTMWSDLMHFEQAGYYQVNYTMPLEMFAKGIFYASIGFYQDKELGYKRMYDHVTRAFRIEIVGTSVWKTQAYGYMRIPAGIGKVVHEK